MKMRQVARDLIVDILQDSLEDINCSHIKKKLLNKWKRGAAEEEHLVVQVTDPGISTEHPPVTR